MRNFFNVYSSVQYDKQILFYIIVYKNSRNSYNNGLFVNIPVLVTSANFYTPTTKKPVV